MAFNDAITYTGPFAGDDLGTPNLFNGLVLQYGTAAARPAAGNKGVIYWATDTEIASYDTGAAWVDLPFLNTLAQTITGIKTFASIPVLPGSDPTTDNQAARKLYIDSLIKRTFGTYTGDNTDNRAIAHGLGSTPHLVIIGGVNNTVHAFVTGTRITTFTANALVTVWDATNFYVSSTTVAMNNSGNSYNWIAWKI